MKSDYCDEDVYKSPPVAVLNLSHDAAEALCVGLSHVTGSKVDWHSMAGRVVVRCLGDRDKVRNVLAGIEGMLKIRGYVTDDEGNALPLVDDVDLYMKKGGTP